MAARVTARCAVETDAAGTIKPTKKKSTDRIDGLVAAIMALSRSDANGGASANDRCYMFVLEP